MKTQIAITGASGFIATSLQNFFADKYDLILISQTSDHAKNTYSWQELQKTPQILAETSCVIHLAGANIGDKRWSSARKDLILNSRLQTTTQLINVLNQLENKPDLLSASAVGIYPTNGEFDEYSVIDHSVYANFCEEITKKWEMLSNDYHGRTVRMRFGVVLSSTGGALNKILLPFKLGVGTGISNGNWSFSWISIVDLCSAIDLLIEKKDIHGIVNMVAPEHILYRHLIQIISKVYRRRLWFNLPAWLIRLMFGQMGEELLLSGQYVVPNRLLEEGFKFQYSDIKTCMIAIRKKKI